MNKKVSIVIPCLNEKSTILRVIKDIKLNIKKYFKINEYEIIVADNGSTDGTIKILKNVRGVRVINTMIKGYGSALHSGILNSNGKYVIYADADLSYPFSNIDKFVDTMSKNPDLVLGTRIKGTISKGSMPFLHRYLGTPILTLLIRLFYGIKTTDCNSGMRMIKKSFYASLRMRNSGMEWASELLLKTSLKRGKYIEVPILFKKDKRGKRPHLSTWSDGWRHLKAILLLKPIILYLFVLLFLILSVYFYVSDVFALTFLFMDLSIVLYLSLLTLNLLSSIIENKETVISNMLKEFKLVPITALFTIFVGVMIFTIPDRHLGTKLFLVSVLGIVFMWIFLVETIKTHLSNKLSDSI